MLVDDHPLVRAGERLLLGEDANIEVVGEASGTQDALEMIAETHPDVVLLDIRLGDDSGITIVPDIQRIAPETKIVVVSSYFNTELVQICEESDVSGYLIKDAEQLDLVSVVKIVASGGKVFDPRVQKVANPSSSSGGSVLTPREYQVLKGVCRGRSNAGIASDLSTTEGTVKGYVSSIMHKLGCESRVQLAMRARDLHIV